jgi:hypothetical protein
MSCGSPPDVPWSEVLDAVHSHLDGEPGQAGTRTFRLSCLASTEQIICTPLLTESVSMCGTNIRQVRFVINRRQASRDAVSSRVGVSCRAQ